MLSRTVSFSVLSTGGDYIIPVIKHSAHSGSFHSGSKTYLTETIFLFVCFIWSTISIESWNCFLLLSKLVSDFPGIALRIRLSYYHYRKYAELHCSAPTSVWKGPSQNNFFSLVLENNAHKRNLQNKSICVILISSVYDIL